MRGLTALLVVLFSLQPAWAAKVGRVVLPTASGSFSAASAGAGLTLPSSPSGLILPAGLSSTQLPAAGASITPTVSISGAVPAQNAGAAFAVSSDQKSPREALILPSREESRRIAGDATEASAQSENAAAADANDRAAAYEAMRGQMTALETANRHMGFAQSHGIRFTFTSFEQNALLGLAPENLAQYEMEDRLIHLNWDMIGPEMRSRKRQGADGLSFLGLGLAPVGAHEAEHARLREEFGENFPPVREEELLTHALQAKVFDEIVRRNGRAIADASSFLFQHTRRTWEFWQAAPAEFANFVLRKNAAIPSINDGAAALREDALRRIESLKASKEPVPPVWLSRLEHTAAFWGDPGRYQALVDFLRHPIAQLIDERTQAHKRARR